jgi:hypothetical protein
MAIKDEKSTSTHRPVTLVDLDGQSRRPKTRPPCQARTRPRRCIGIGSRYPSVRDHGIILRRQESAAIFYKSPRALDAHGDRHNQLIYRAFSSVSATRYGMGDALHRATATESDAAGNLRLSIPRPWRTRYVPEDPPDRSPRASSQESAHVRLHVRVLASGGQRFWCRSLCPECATALA